MRCTSAARAGPARAGFPGLYASQIDRLFTSMSGFTVSVLPDAFMSRGKRRISFLTLIVELLLTAVLPVVFGLYAYWQLFARKGFANAFVWATLVPAIVFVVLGLMLVVTSPSYSDPREDEQWSLMSP